MTHALTKVFDINEYLQEHAVFLATENNDNKQDKVLYFDLLVEKIRESLSEKYDDNKITDQQLADRQELEHQGALGVAKAENMLVSEIETLLREQNLLGVTYPDFYDSLAHGLFHEIYRFGTFHKWESYPDSPSAKIVGKEIWFKVDGSFKKQKEELKDDKQVEEIIRLLQIGNSGFKVNEANPQDEIVLENGVRVKVLIPPLSQTPTIVFRRFVVKNFSFQKQAHYGTIPVEDISFYESLSNLYLNTIIAGEVESGKSTFLKTVYGTRDKDRVAILIESSPETFLKRDFPDRLVHELYTDKNGDIHAIIRDVLRIDHDYVIVQEVRGIEAEGAISATERGTRGTLITYHITDPLNTSEQLAQHIVDAFPNRRMTSEMRRISKQLDLGITMETFENNQKKVTSVYEMCNDNEKDKAWINYLIKYDKQSDQWYYNPTISEQLKEKMSIYDQSLTDYVLNHLKKRSERYPITTNTYQEIHFKE